MASINSPLHINYGFPKFKKKNCWRYEFRVRKAQISNERIDRRNRESGKQLKYRQFYSEIESVDEGNIKIDLINEYFYLIKTNYS